MRWGHRIRTGLDITPNGVTLVRLRQRGRRQLLVEHHTEAIEKGALVVSPVEPNIKDEDAVSAVIQRIAGTRRGRVGVSLPDPVARVGLFDVTSVPSRASEFERLVRWHLEKTFSADFSSARLACQRYSRPDGHDGARILGVAIAPPVLEQYENLLTRLGFEPEVIDLAVFQRFNLFRRKIQRSARPEYHFIVLVVTSSSFSIIVFESGRPAYIRLKGTRKTSAGRDAMQWIAHEVELSLNAYGKEKDLSRITHLFLSTTEPMDGLSESLSAQLHLIVEVLDSHASEIEQPSVLSLVDWGAAGGALGAAWAR